MGKGYSGGFGRPGLSGWSSYYARPRSVGTVVKPGRSYISRQHLKRTFGWLPKALPYYRAYTKDGLGGLAKKVAFDYGSDLASRAANRVLDWTAKWLTWD